MAASSSAGKKIANFHFQRWPQVVVVEHNPPNFSPKLSLNDKDFHQRLPCCDPSAQGTRGTCRGQPPTFANATLCIFCRSPSLRHRCWKGPQTGLEVFEQSARKVLIKISSHKGCHSNLKNLKLRSLQQLNVDNSVQILQIFTKLSPDWSNSLETDCSVESFKLKIVVGTQRLPLLLLQRFTAANKAGLDPGHRYGWSSGLWSAHLLKRREAQSPG